MGENNLEQGYVKETCTDEICETELCADEVCTDELCADEISVGATFDKKLTILGKPVRIQITDTGRGMNILLYGGDSAHIGAVSVAENGNLLQSIEFPGHKEEVVSRKWAKCISGVYAGPVVVEAGIHYDEISKERIQKILNILDLELEKLREQYVRRTNGFDLSKKETREKAQNGEKR